MANNRINYADKVNKLLDEMPDFVSDFIFNFGHSDQPATMFEYCRDIFNFLQFMTSELNEFSNIPVDKITLYDLGKLETDDISKYLDSLLNEKDGRLSATNRALSTKRMGTSTIKRRRATLSSMFSYFVENGKLEKNPVLGTKPIRPAEKPLVYLTNEEQKLLLDTVKSGDKLSEKAVAYHTRYEERDSALFLLLLDTGLRVSEMLSTDIADYDLENCSVLVRRRGGVLENVYFSDECAYYLDTYFYSQRSKYLISDNEIPAFTTIQGERLGVRAVEKLVKKYVTACMPEKAKLISPHKLRSSFAMSFYAANNNNLLLLQKKLNHKSLTTTNVYAKASEADVEDTRNSLQGLR